ncbi:MAG: Nudix family hydrolase [Panacagrimonas sp.]
MNPARPPIAVACGALRRADGKLLLAQRPVGKIAAGKWEFPGGKIESGESLQSALWRELEEELGIHPGTSRPLIRFRHAYSDRTVDLQTCLVEDWRGEIQARESQSFAWVDPHQETALDVLPTVAPILHALRLPAHYVFTPPDATPASIGGGLARLPRACLLRLRLPQLDDARYRACAAQLAVLARPLGIGLILDRDPPMVRQVGAAGLHLTQRALMTKSEVGPDVGLRIASCHDAACIAEARRRGLDAVVVGAVKPTATHPGRAPLGWRGFSDATVPAYAIGGLGPNDASASFSAGAQGVAGISAYWSEPS